ncbi:MAG: TspO/MBR family protein [Chitinophagales bacterium]
MKFFLHFALFLVVNFAALGIGSLFMGDAVGGKWYQSLNKAPWTPPGWVFGVAWSFVMFMLSLFMAFVVQKHKAWNIGKPVILLFWIQWILNVAWNYIFFNQQLILPGLLEITLLFFVVFALFYSGYGEFGVKSFLLLPYIIWVLIAVSLNAYIFMFN